MFLLIVSVVNGNAQSAISRCMVAYSLVIWPYSRQTSSTMVCRPDVSPLLPLRELRELCSWGNLGESIILEGVNKAILKKSFVGTERLIRLCLTFMRLTK